MYWVENFLTKTFIVMFYFIFSFLIHFTNFFFVFPNIKKIRWNTQGTLVIIWNSMSCCSGNFIFTILYFLFSQENKKNYTTGSFGLILSSQHRQSWVSHPCNVSLCAHPGVTYSVYNFLLTLYRNHKSITRLCLPINSDIYSNLIK